MADEKLKVYHSPSEVHKVPLKYMRDKVYKMYKSMVKNKRELAAFHSSLAERNKENGDGTQDSMIMESAIAEMEKTIEQLGKLYKWISFINEYGPVSDK